MMALSDSSFLSSSWDHGQCGSDMSHDARQIWKMAAGTK